MAPPRSKTKAPSEPPAQTAALTCPECGKTFTRAAALGAHRKMTHGVAGSSKNATAKRRTTRTNTAQTATTRTAQPSRSRRTRTSTSNTTVNRDALLRALFPNGIPPREELIGELNDWLNQAERLAKRR